MAEDKNKEKTIRQKPFSGQTGLEDLLISDPSTTYTNAFENFIQFTSTISGDSVKFKAFLTAFDDQFSSEWNSEQVYGRNDPIQTFKNTTRKINIGWDTPAFSVYEARNNMARSAQLIRMLYPSYESRDSVSTINRSPLIKVKFRNLIKNSSSEALLVTIDSINFSPDLEAGWFDRDSLIDAGTLVGRRPESGNAPDELMPKLLKFSCVMTVLHTETVGHFGRKWSSNHKNFPNLPDHLRAGEIINEPIFVQGVGTAVTEADAAETAADQAAAWDPVVDNDDEFETSDESANANANNEGVDSNDQAPNNKAATIPGQDQATIESTLGVGADASALTGKLT